MRRDLKGFLHPQPPEGFPPLRPSALESLPLGLSRALTFTESLVLTGALWSFVVETVSNLNVFILFIYFWLCWVSIAACGLSLAAASGGYSSLRCAGFLLRSMGSRRVGSVVVAHGL